MQTPKVSVVIPNFNYGRYLRQRLESVLSQSFDDYEIILLDDCSTDDSRLIIEEYKDDRHVSAIVYNKANSGSPFVQWQRGIELAKGQYVWIAESDDFCSESFLDTTVRALDANPTASYAMVGSTLVDENSNPLPIDYDGWKEDGKTVVFDGREYIKHCLVWRNTAYNASMILFRRSASLNVSKKYTKMRYCGDWQFWMEMALQGDVVECHCKCSSFRQHCQRVTEKSANSIAQMQERLFVLNQIWRLPYIGQYRKWLSKGMLKKEVMRMNVESDKREKINTLLRDNGIMIKHYIVERTVKYLNQLIPSITTPTNDRRKWSK